FVASSSSIDILLLMFFFSSRRRHTRFSRDWSSDVCSSDLVRVLGRRRDRGGARGRSRRGGGLAGDPFGRGGRERGCGRHRPSARSEERRVGKEGRRRGGVGW